MSEVVFEALMERADSRYDGSGAGVGRDSATWRSLNSVSDLDEEPHPNRDICRVCCRKSSLEDCAGFGNFVRGAEEVTLTDENCIG